MPFKVVLDANVLYPFSLRDTLLRLAERELYVHVWSEQILTEMERNLVKHKRKTRKSAARMKAQMKDAFEEAMVDAAAINALVPAMTNHPGDRHVLATAIVADAEGIVSFNRKHFPDRALKPFNRTLLHPDDFLCDLYDRYPAIVASVIIEQAAHLRNPPVSVEEILGMLDRGGVKNFVACLRRHLGLVP